MLTWSKMRQVNGNVVEVHELSKWVCHHVSEDVVSQEVDRVLDNDQDISKPSVKKEAPEPVSVVELAAAPTEVS